MPMRYRSLGISDVVVSEIGFGAWGIGSAIGNAAYGKTDDAISLRALQCALENGITFYDTSNLYGMGHSETLLGRAFVRQRDKVVIATKAGYADTATRSYAADAMARSFQASLDRLQTDYVDVLQVHDADAEELTKAPGTLKWLARIKQEGRARLIGASVRNPSDIAGLLDVFPFDVVQANFNMLDVRLASDNHLVLLRQKQIGLIARTPLAFGFLTGKLTGEEAFPADDHRSRWSREQLRLWAQGAQELFAACPETATSSPERIALRFCLSFPETSCVIPGMLNASEVDSNVAAAAEGALSLASCQNILALHSCKHYFMRSLNKGYRTQST